MQLIDFWSLEITEIKFEIRNQLKINKTLYIISASVGPLDVKK